MLDFELTAHWPAYSHNTFEERMRHGVGAEALSLSALGASKRCDDDMPSRHRAVRNCRLTYSALII